jgi:hypothetical protein
MNKDETIDVDVLDYGNKYNQEASKNKLLWLVNIIIIGSILIFYIR